MRHASYVPDFSSLRVAVIGDLIADHYVYTRPGRLSREAPVMVMQHSAEELRAGGAANLARNLWSLGARVSVHGVVGRDARGQALLRLLGEEQLDLSGVEAVDSWVTPTKTRICSAEASRTYQQVLRIDREPEAPLEDVLMRRFAERVRALEGEVDALLLSDYQYGLIDARVAEAARDLAEAGTTVVLDPRSALDPFRGLTAITPNLAELASATNARPEELEDPERLAESAGRVLGRTRPDWLLVTLGNRGMALFGRDLPSEGMHVAASGSEVGLDPTGAGDTAAATFTLALASGASGPEAMKLANAASGVVVQENGTAVCSPSRLRSALAQAPSPSVQQSALTR